MCIKWAAGLSSCEVGRKMVEQPRFPCHWRSMLIKLREEEGWELTEDDIHDYACAFVAFLPLDCSEPDLYRACKNYHKDHEFVEALLDSARFNHENAWQECSNKVTDILRKTHLLWSKDAAIDGDDFMQIAQMALVTSLPSFVYRSSFSTWLHTVVLHSVKRTIRDSYAQKRAVRPESLDAILEPAVTVPEEQLPENTANYEILIDLVCQILEQADDKRLVDIFQLSAVKDCTTEQIGKRVHLHPSRVRALLSQARYALQNHPQMKEWLETADFPLDEV